MDLLPHPAQLHHRKPCGLGQLPDIRRQGAGAADAVAEDIPSAAGRRPAIAPQSDCRSSSVGSSTTGTRRPGDLLHNGLPLPLPDGEVGKARKVLPQLLLHAVRHLGNPKGGGVGNFALFRKDAKKHRVEPTIREDLRVPDLVAAGEDQVIGKLRAPKLLQICKLMGRNAQIFAGKCLKALIAAFRGP